MPQKLYDLCDIILDKIKGVGNTSIEPFYNAYNLNEIKSAIHQLGKDGYIKLSNDKQYMAITPAGEVFIKNGGYDNDFNEKAKREEYNEQLRLSTIATNKSVQDTNDATKNNFVTQQNNFVIQRNLTIASILVSTLAVIFAAIALFKDTDAEMRAQNKILEKQRQTIDSIRLYLKAGQFFPDSSRMKH